MTTLTKTIKQAFTATSARAWPKGLGDMPGEPALKLAHTFNKPGTALAAAWAMYARPGGATDHEAAAAASLLTGSKSASHRVKVDQQVKLGKVKRTAVGKREGKTVYRISLPGKAAGTGTGKAKRKAKATAKPATSEATANADNS